MATEVSSQQVLNQYLQAPSRITSNLVIGACLTAIGAAAHAFKARAAGLALFQRATLIAQMPIAIASFVTYLAICTIRSFWQERPALHGLLTEALTKNSDLTIAHHPDSGGISVTTTNGKTHYFSADPDDPSRIKLYTNSQWENISPESLKTLLTPASTETPPEFIESLLTRQSMPKPEVLPAALPCVEASDLDWTTTVQILENTPGSTWFERKFDANATTYCIENETGKYFLYINQETPFGESKTIFHLRTEERDFGYFNITAEMLRIFIERKVIRLQLPEDPTHTIEFINPGWVPIAEHMAKLDENIVTIELGGKKYYFKVDRKKEN